MALIFSSGPMTKTERTVALSAAVRPSEVVPSPSGPMHRLCCADDPDCRSWQQGSAGITDRAAEIDAITGAQSMPERPVQTCAIQARRRHEPDLGLLEGIVDHLLFDQDESRTGGALGRNIGVTFSMHGFQPIGDANRHALLKTSRCTAQTTPRNRGCAVRNAVSAVAMARSMTVNR